MVVTDYGKETLRTLALMDLEKVNNELLLELLTWIVTGNHQVRKRWATIIALTCQSADVVIHLSHTHSPIVVCNR